MRFIITTLLLLSTPVVFAASNEECLNMARDYLVAVENDQSDTLIIYARENFLSRCKTENTFNQHLAQLVAGNKVIKAIHVRKKNKCKHTNLSTM